MSKIYIKPENKGKFTATKKATGKSTEELTHSKNPLTRKRAIFAQNAKKWKHQEGGLLERKGVPYITLNSDKIEFPYNGKSMYKGGYNLKRALELYKPDETGHLPSVDSETGEWLKDKDHPTAWKELMQTTLNLNLNKQVGFPVLNSNGRLQYINKHQEGGIILPKFQQGTWSPFTQTKEKEEAYKKLVQQRALQGYNTSGSTVLRESPEMVKKREALSNRMYNEAQAQKFANRTNEVQQAGVPAATNIGLKNVNPEFALMTGGVGMGLFKGLPGFAMHGASQGALMNVSGLSSEQNLQGLATDIIAGGLIGGVIGEGARLIKPIVKTGVNNIYKVNPFANNLGKYNRVVGKDAIEDIINNGVVRSNTQSAGVSLDGLGKRTTPYPSFSKGKPNQVYIDQTISQGKTPYIISTNRPMGISTLGRHGKGSTRFPIDKNGQFLESTPISEYKVYSSNTPHWLKGYDRVDLNKMKPFDPTKIDLSRFRDIAEGNIVTYGLPDKIKYNFLKAKVENPKFGSFINNFENKIPFYKSERRNAITNAIHLENLKDDLIKKQIEKAGLGEQVGRGHFGKVRVLKEDPNYVIKIGYNPPGDDPVKLAEIGKTFKNKERFVFPIKAQNFNNDRFASIMDKIDGIGIDNIDLVRGSNDVLLGSNNVKLFPRNRFSGETAVHRQEIPKIPRSEVARAAWDIRRLNQNGVEFDYAGNNAIYQPDTKQLKLIDLNIGNRAASERTWFDGPNAVGQNPATMLKNKLYGKIEPKKK